MKIQEVNRLDNRHKWDQYDTEVWDRLYECAVCRKIVRIVGIAPAWGNKLLEAVQPTKFERFVK